MTAARVELGDCVQVLAAMPEASVDAVVCDPPYGLEFMGKEWDRLGAGVETVAEGTDESHPFRDGTQRVRYGVSAASMQTWHESWARQALRVLKPGGHLLAFGGTRTYHRLACALEDAGFEIRDCLTWLYGSGFPKSLDVSRAVDQAQGIDTTADERWTPTPHFVTGAMRTASGNSQQVGQALPGERVLYAPASAAAEQWQGWGTALKPANEPVVLARRPLDGTVAATVLAHGTGALNVDGCRLDARGEEQVQGAYVGSDVQVAGERDAGKVYGADLGRWPANVLLDESAAQQLDEQAGERAAGNHPAHRAGERGENVYGLGHVGTDGERRPTEAGGASRFFYVAKASAAERNAGLAAFEALFAPTMGNGIGGKEHDPDTATPKRNVHPTVKPIALMRWLCRLVTPAGGTVLDPFTGSGTTGIAAGLEGYEFVGVERDPEYVAIARARIAWWSLHPAGVELADALAAESRREQVRASGQLGLFDEGSDSPQPIRPSPMQGETGRDQR